MNRLPGGDPTTRWSESVVFASLGLAGVLMVALAAAQMTKFVAGSDRVAAALAGRPASLAVATPADDALAVATDVSGPVDSRAAAHDPAKENTPSATDSGLDLLLW
jgi:hypothetical protein